MEHTQKAARLVPLRADLMGLVWRHLTYFGLTRQEAIDDCRQIAGRLREDDLGRENRS